ncbi:MAG: hypothetical protein LAT67_08745, partial [Balneolales bacterium]|nr:hypothetical protein [Balneolales bacterium]
AGWCERTDRELIPIFLLDFTKDILKLGKSCDTLAYFFAYAIALNHLFSDSGKGWAVGANGTILRYNLDGPPTSLPGTDTPDGFMLNQKLS